MAQTYHRREIADYCLQHAIRRITETPAQTRPYPHFWIEGIFPDDVYDDIVRAFPEQELFDGYETNEFHRLSMHLLSKDIERFPQHAQQLWLAVRDVMASQELKEAIFRKLAAGFSHRFGVAEEKVNEIVAYPRPMLYSETSGYRIKPHPDTRRKLATVQFAITEGTDQSDLGTSMYKLSAMPTDLIQEPRGFREVGRRPFVRNSVFAFSVVNTLTMRSWHGREALPEDCGVRRTILQIYYADAADANPEIVEETPAQLAA